MIIKEFIKNNITKLKEITDIPQKEIYILLGYILKKDFLWLNINNDYLLTKEEILELDKLIELRSSAYPLEYITQKVSFYSQEFDIRQGVLIPRPETELLVDKAIEILANIDSPKVVEVGVGSGIISILLAQKIDDIEITAVDINQEALSLAKQNAIKKGVIDKIEFKQSDMFSKLDDSSFDMLISNPPYIANSFDLPKNVQYEPKEALFGGKSGDEMIKSMIKECYDRKIRYFCCEMGYDQKEKLIKEFLMYNCKYDFYQDYSGFDRGFVLEFI